MMLCVYIYLIVKALYPGIDECPGIGRLVDAITLLVLPIGDGGLIDVGVDRSWKKYNTFSDFFPRNSRVSRCAGRRTRGCPSNPLEHGLQ